MEIKGRIILSLPEQTGTTKTGNAWRAKTVVIETLGQYPKKVAVTFWNDRIDIAPAIGADVILHVEAESREYNGRWYTEVKAWKVEHMPMPTPMQKVVKTFDAVPAEQDDDLPF